MISSLKSILSALRQNPIKSTITVFALVAIAFAALYLFAFIVDAFFPYNFAEWYLSRYLPVPLTFLGLIVAVFILSKRVSALSWFWHGSEVASQCDDTAKPTVSEAPQSAENSQTHASGERYAEPSPTRIPYCKAVRDVPQGTMIVSRTADQAVLKVKSAIRFWCWFLPTTFFVLAVLSVPVGSAVGFMIYTEQGRGFRGDPASFVMWGALIPAGICLLIAFMTYGSTRPWVLVAITPDTIRYGDATYDRDHSRGMRIGYTSDETQLKSSFLAPSFGVQTLRLTYGRWGEDLKYMVDKYHAPEIVIWMNEIIDSVGAPPPKRYDPYAGQKIELL
ncbi:hypothetical protein [Fluviibacterium sp. S390]|uniref:hypothetical protein n=1 Tax=Fluviibacterium sp. S390 TaxID=3415139 RepID=UPI003C7DD539